MNARASDGYGDDDRLPWLETVDDDPREGSSARRIVLVIALLALVAAAAAAVWVWTQQRQGVAGTGELIAAQEGDYKVKPEEPGGMKVDGEGDTVFATSQGAASNSSINVGALPEAPVEGKAAPATDAAPGTRSATLQLPTAPANRPSVPTRASTAAGSAPAASGALIQLGAFPSEGGANIAWARLSKRFSYIAALGKSVERAEVDGKGVWRLRVNAGSNGQARDLCGRLKVAGENCFVTH